MSSFSEQVSRLCPNGVKHCPLSEVAHYSKDRIDAIEVDQDTYVGVDNLLSDRKGKVVSSYVPEEGRLIKYNTGNILIGNIRPYLKKIWLADSNGGTNGDVLVIQIDDLSVMSPNFLYYVLSSDSFFAYNTVNAKGAKMPRGDKAAIMKYVVPVPPLSIQNEIVRILDKLTADTAELINALSIEREVRSKQYEYYRNKLLSFDVRGGGTNDVQWRTLRELAQNCDSQRKPITGIFRNKGIYPYYGASGIVDYIDNYLFDGDYLLVSEDGANLLARNTPIAFSIAGKTWVNNHAHVLHFEEYSTRKYVEYYLNSIDLTQFISGGAQPKLNQQNLNRIPIPTPSLDKQRRIVSILDRFDALCNDLTSGLPAEIEARRRQYEYYRDKLLTFKELGA